MGPSIKDVGIYLAVFDTPSPHVEILTLIYLISTFQYLATSEFETPLPPEIFRRLLWMAHRITAMEIHSLHVVVSHKKSVEKSRVSTLL